jgi:hypothetical protein
MEKKDYYKYMCLLAALWNIGASLLFLILSIIDKSIFLTMGMQIPPSLFFLHVFIFLVISFGIGYILVSRDINKNHGVVIIGIIGKISFFICALIYMLLGDANFLLVVLGIVDIFFVCLFIEFLINFKKI